MKAKTKRKLVKKKSFIKQAHHKIHRGIKLTFIPHAENDYRPHLIRRYGLLVILCLVVGIQFGYNEIKTGKVLGRESNITISELYNQTNQERTSAGLSTLDLNDKLNQAAYLKAQDMFADQYWSHVAPDGTQPWKWFSDAGYNYNEAGENLAKGFTTTSGVMTAWMNSKDHRENILKSDYQDVGFAVVSGELNGEQITLVVAMYGSPAESAVAGAQTSVAEEASSGTTNILTKLAVALESITPAAIVGLILMTVAMMTATLAHVYRRSLPKSLRNSWYRHHGIYKGVGMMVLSLITLLMYSGGQI